MDRWKINLYTLWVAQVFSLMGFGLCIPFTPFFLMELGVTDPVELSYYIGISATLPATTMAFAAPLWGIAADRYGRKMMIMRAMIGAALILVLMGLSQQLWQFLSLRALQGIMTGTVTASMGFVSANTPERKLSYALGLMTSSNFLGYSVGPLIGGVLAEFLGYRFCFIFGGILMFVGFFLVIFLVVEDKNTYGYRIKKEDKGVKKKTVSPQVLKILCSLFFQRLARSMFVPFIPLFVQEILGTAVGASAYTGLVNGSISLATAIAALTITRLGDKKEKGKLALLLTFLTLPVALLLLPIKSLALFILVFTVYFFLAGATEPILTSAASEQTPMALRGALFGWLGTVNSLGTMAAPLIGSHITVKFSVRSIFAVIPLLIIIQLFFLYSLKKPVKRMKAEGDENDD